MGNGDSGIVDSGFSRLFGQFRRQSLGFHLPAETSGCTLSCICLLARLNIKGRNISQGMNPHQIMKQNRESEDE